VYPVEDACAVILEAEQPVGRLRLWLPEGISSNVGFSSVYPVGRPWQRTAAGWTQHITADCLFSGGNFVRVNEHTLECAGIQVPVDQPVEWTTSITSRGNTAWFSIRITNVGDKPIKRAGAAVCLKFVDADWWSPERVFVRSEGRVQSLADLDADELEGLNQSPADLAMPAGRADSFEAYLVSNHRYDNFFYQGFWGFNTHRLDDPTMVSEHPDKVSVMISAPSAYFLHCNRGNPCTDVMLAFGDIAPGESKESWGAVSLSYGEASEALDDTLRAVSPSEE
jgi:hypothetical protein